MSSRDTGAQLLLSARTVEWHLRKVALTQLEHRCLSA
jgi:DNA-binding CsgD family transcriptional regulator